MAKATNTEIIDLLGEKFGEQLFDVTEPYGLLTFSTTKDKIIIGDIKPIGGGEVKG